MLAVLLLHGCVEGSGQADKSPDDPAMDVVIGDTADTAIVEADTAETGLDSGDTGDSVPPSDVDGDGFDAPEDCDDLDPESFPGAVDVCDGVDQDCDGDPQGTGSCANPIDLRELAQYLWVGKESEYFGAGSPEYVDETPVLLGRILGTDRSEVAGAGLGALIMVGIPGDDHDWLPNVLGMWRGSDSEPFTVYDFDVGDFDGDGYDDVVMGSASVYQDEVEQISVVSGPATLWSATGDVYSEVRSGFWTGRTVNDKMAYEVISGGDVDGDGREEILTFATGTNGTLILIPGGSEFPTTGREVTDESWVDVRAGEYNAHSMVADLNGDGVRDFIGGRGDDVVVIDGAVMMSCSGCSGDDIQTVILESGDEHVFTGSSRRMEAGDVTGDGVVEFVVLSEVNVSNTYAVDCALWVDGATAGRGALTTTDATTRACTDQNDGIGYILGEDADGDAVGDPQISFPSDRDEAEGAHEYSCLFPSHRLVPYVAVDVLSNSWCPDYLFGVAGDLSGDGFSEFVGIDDEFLDPDYKGNTYVMLGFDIPWDDPTKW